MRSVLLATLFPMDRGRIFRLMLALIVTAAGVRFVPSAGFGSVQALVVGYCCVAPGRQCTEMSESPTMRGATRCENLTPQGAVARAQFVRIIGGQNVVDHAKRDEARNRCNEICRAPVPCCIPAAPEVPARCNSMPEAACRGLRGDPMPGLEMPMCEARLANNCASQTKFFCNPSQPRVQNAEGNFKGVCRIVRPSLNGNYQPDGPGGPKYVMPAPLYDSKSETWGECVDKCGKYYCAYIPAGNLGILRGCSNRPFIANAAFPRPCLDNQATYLTTNGISWLHPPYCPPYAPAQNENVHAQTPVERVSKLALTRSRPANGNRPDADLGFETQVACNNACCGNDRCWPTCVGVGCLTTPPQQPNVPRPNQPNVPRPNQPIPR